MQRELRSEHPELVTDAHGVNAPGNESGNAIMCAGRILPWLQDDLTHDVWGQWAVTFRDFVILDRANKVLRIYNLTEHDLSSQSNYDELKALLIAAASAP